MAPLVPDVPLHGPWGHVAHWLDRLPLATDLSSDDIAWSPVLSEASFAPGETELRELWTTGGHLSWLGGPAVPTSQWPRRPDDRPLAHVVTLHLADVAGALDAQGKAVWPGLREGLPDAGVLEVFHDLETYGYEPDDGEAGGWLVRWHPDPDTSGLTAPPDDDVAPTRACQVVLALPGWTLPFADRLGGPHGEEAAALSEALDRAWLHQRTGSADGYPIPFSHVYGHGHSGSATALDVLASARPLRSPDDEHRLVLDLESWSTLQDWFGDASPLEVWMRQSDLDARDFSAAWCMIRTD